MPMYCCMWEPSQSLVDDTYTLSEKLVTFCNCNVLQIRIVFGLFVCGATERDFFKHCDTTKVLTTKHSGSNL